MRWRPALASVLLAGCVAKDGANGDGDGDGSTVRDELLDPATCESCHPTHYRQWLGSMHAYAAEDPVFLAMNARGQRETNGELGDFCVNCHAPMAVALGETEDGLDLDQVPQHLQGITCYFCHNVEAVEGTHNNPLVLAMDDVMRGGIDDPSDNDGAHEAAYSPLLDERAMESSDLCGSCHDIVTPAGVHMERTYQEWLDGLFADTDPATGGPAYYSQRCGTCHMGPPTPGPIADFDGVPGDRLLHHHYFEGVDVAITDFPDATLGPELKMEQLEAIADTRKTAICSTICVRPGEQSGFDVEVWLHNEGSGHAWPSGATQDRRAWLELVARAGDEVLYEVGVIADDQAVDPPGVEDDPDLWLLRDWLYDQDGKEVHMFWEAAPSDAYPEGFEHQALEVAALFTDKQGWISRVFHVDDDRLDRVDTRLRLRPMPLDLIADLIESGDLDPKFRDAIETFDVEPSVLQWTPDAEMFEGYGTCVGSSPGCRAPCVLTDDGFDACE